MKLRHWRPLLVAAAVLVGSLLAGCGGGTPELFLLDPLAAYRTAVADAEVAEPHEICRTLTPIVDWNPGLRWQGSGDDRRVLVVTWTSWPGYDPAVGQPVTLAVDVWVTVAGELPAWFVANRTPAHRLIQRCEQLLGLPPETGKDRFVELWARPGDLFRPSPDPEITDTVAELDFPGPSGLITVSPDHIAWFNAQRAQSYGPAGYPWTRLGYTYDWGNPRDEVGLSEFVIRRGAAVVVEAVRGNASYLSPN